VHPVAGVCSWRGDHSGDEVTNRRERRVMDNVSDEIAEVIRQLPTAQELELEALRRRVKRQRAELRRLSQKDQMFAKGFRRGLDVERYHWLRNLMCRTFGD